ncbi:MAG: adenylate/guanylate cyclase domain-containing protein [Acidimicrobiia bacterium]
MQLEERRVVTVLFADIVGFTALAEHLDPEQVKRMVDSCFERLVQDIDAFGGRVDKLLGDGIIALFGAPIAHEDDAERAVRAALRMQHTIEDHSTRTDSPVQLRIGVSTGEVLVGALRAGGDYTAMGDVVNMASRLQAAAPPGSVLVGPSTHALTEKVITYEPFGDMQLRGREQATSAWLAGAVIAPPGGHRHRPHTPLVGREEELGLLVSSLELSIARRRAVLAAIAGEGGVGKSRLVEEVLSVIVDRHEVLLLEGTCVPYGEANVWWPLASALFRRLGLDSASPPEEVRARAGERARQLLAPNTDPQEIRRIEDAFLHLVGFPSPLEEHDPARAREEVVRAVVQVLQARLRLGPVVISVTDLHWADTAMLELFEQVLVALAGQPFILITTARPDTELDWPPLTGRYTSVALRLETLDRDSSLQLASAILGEGADLDIAERLFERSGGNPLFLEELATLIAGSGPTSVLPDSLRALIAARLDQLPPDQRVLLDNAAVLGGAGAWGQLVRFGDELGQPAEIAALNGLIAAGLLALDGRRWRFRSESVREVAYQTLTKASRAVRHLGVARAMEDSGKAVPDDVAHHYATAAELTRELGAINGVPKDVTALAVRWLTEAAERAIDQMSAKAGVRLATRGIDLLEGVEGEEASQRRRRLLLARADGLSDRREFDRARDDLAAALSDALRHDDRASEASAHRLLGEVERLAGDSDASRRELGEAVRLWRDIGDERELARALRGRGFLEVFSGSPVDAEKYLYEADELYQRLGDRGGRAWVAQHRAWMAFLGGNIAEADERLHQAAETMAELGDRGGLGWAFGLLAYVRFFAGDRAEAADLAASVLAEAIDRGDDWAAGMMQTLQSNLAMWEGKVEDALQLADEARSRMRRLGDRYGEVQAIAAMLRSNVALGRGPTAAKLAEELSAAASSFGVEGFAQLARSGVALLGGWSERAIEAATAAIDQARERGALGSFDALVVRAIALLMEGRLDDALADLALAEDEYPGTSFGHAAAALAAALGHRPDEVLVHADAVAAHRSTTYLDRVYAAIAAASARRQLGDDRAARFVLDEVQIVANATDDKIARAIMNEARRSFGFASEDECLDDVSLKGWERLIASLAQVTVDG